MMQGAAPRPRLSFGAQIAPGERVLPQEVAVALSFNGTTQAVMMATPDHLADFAYGFALTEGLARPDEIESLDVVETERGLDVQLWVNIAAEARLKARRRVMAGPVGCGLCGIDSLEQALRDLTPVPHGAFRLTPAQVMAGVAALPGQQALHDATRAAHCAAFWDGARVVVAREDVGRHNALDKLTGAMARAGLPLSPGFVLSTARCSYEIVEKAVRAGATTLVTISLPTTMATERAKAAGLSLWALARDDSVLLVNDGSG